MLGTARGHILQTAWALCVVALVAAVACTGSGVSPIPSGPPFPFAGPSCSGSDLNHSCWDCVDTEGGPAGCITSQCSAYFTCFCACGASDTACQDGCRSKQTAACGSCLRAVTAYEEATCPTLCPGIDAGIEASADAGEASAETGAEASAEASVDGGVEASVEAAVDSGRAADARADAPADGAGESSAPEAGAGD